MCSNIVYDLYMKRMKLTIRRSYLMLNVNYKYEPYVFMPSVWSRDIAYQSTERNASRSLAHYDRGSIENSITHVTRLFFSFFIYGYLRNTGKLF